MRKFLDYLHLRDVGGFEMLMAFFPILIGYRVAGLPLGLVLCLIITLFLVLKKGTFILNRKSPILIWIAFVLFHDFIKLFAITTAQGVYINNLFGCVAYCVTAVAVGNCIDFKKFRGCINWVSLLCMGGMLYHFSLVLRGASFSPLTLPFLPVQETSRALFEIQRPSSFFWEPQSYVSFMMIPLFMALLENKMLWASVIGITIFMSSSTTGLVEVFIIFGLFVINRKSQHNKWTSRLFLLFLVGILLYFMMNSGLFGQGIEKVAYESDNWETQVRLVQGPIVVSNMNPTEWLLGTPFANAYQFCVGRGIIGQVVVYGENSMYVPAFWNALLQYGLLGLLFYLNIYFVYYKKNTLIRPYLICLFLVLFTNPDFMGGVFCFAMIFIISLTNYINRLNNYEGNTYRVRIR